jgi:hypothetical protein
MATNDDALGRFLLDLLPATAREHLRRLAELRYPIPDRRSLAEQLGADADREEDRADAGLLSAFLPEDFGLDTVQSALEKYRGRVPWTLGAALPLDDAGRRTLDHALSSGGLEVTGTSIVARGRGNAAVEADCGCLDATGTQGTGKCSILVVGNILTCSQGSCTGTCGLVVTIPTAFFARA